VVADWVITGNFLATDETRIERRFFLRELREFSLIKFVLIGVIRVKTFSWKNPKGI